MFNDETKTTADADSQEPQVQDKLTGLPAAAARASKRFSQI